MTMLRYSAETKVDCCFVGSCVAMYFRVWGEGRRRINQVSRICAGGV